MSAPSPTIDAVTTSRGRRTRRRRLLIAGAVLVLVVVFMLALMLGQSFTPPDVVLAVLLGQDVPGASFTIGTLRLPRAVLAILAGLSFGMSGAAFQVMLRNPLASPDIIGISYGASAAAVFAIVILSMGGVMISVFAVTGGLGVAVLVYALSSRNGVAGTRFILVGIGVAAMLESFISYTLSQAPSWNLQEAMRWLTGSVNGARLEQSLPLALALLGFGGLLLSRARDLEALRLGDDMASALGVDVARTRKVVIVTAVGTLAVATAVTGPIAFVAFLSGPIAARIVGSQGSLLLPSALVGALLVLVGDYVGQFMLPGRYPVGVVTGALGAPYLIYLIIRVNRTGRSL